MMPATMGTLQIIAWVAEVGSFALVIITGISITKDVNDSLRESYNGIWSVHGNKIWKGMSDCFPPAGKGFFSLPRC